MPLHLLWRGHNNYALRKKQSPSRKNKTKLYKVTAKDRYSWDFSVAGPAAWNSLPDYLRDPTRSVDSFRRDLTTLLLVLLAYTAH